MRHSFMIIVLGLAYVTTLSAAPFEGKIIQIKLSKTKVITGELGRENGSHIELLDLRTGKKVIHEKSRLIAIERDLSTQDIKNAVGLGNYVGWMIRKKTPDSQQAGVVADIASSGISVTLGKKHGIVVGQLLDVLQLRGEIKDPVTGKVLGKRREKVSALRVTEVQDGFSVARVTKGIKKNISKGDQVVPQVASNAIAIFPLVRTDGGRSRAGNGLAEELTTSVVRFGVPVVERKLLVGAIVELAIQQTGLFDPAKAQQCGKQIGAFAVLTGTVSSKGKCQLRLIDVSTARILFAVSHDLTTESVTRLESSAPLDQRDWYMRCYHARQKAWRVHPLSKATVTQKDGVLTVKNTTGLHTFANLTHRDVLQGDFELKFEWKGGQTMAIAETSGAGGKGILITLPTDDRKWHTGTVTRRGSKLGVVFDGRPAKVRFFNNTPPTHAGNFLISVASGKSVAIREFRITRK